MHPALTSQVRRQDGRLVFTNLPAGQYVLSNGGSLNIFVAGDDVVNVSIPARPRGNVSRGRVSFEGGGARPAPDQLQIVSQVAGEAAAIGPGPMVASIDQTGNATWQPFGRSPSVVRLLAAPRGWALKRVTLGAQDVTDTSLDFTSGLENLEILLTNRTGSVAGVVAGQIVASHSVILVAEDRERWTYPSRFIHVGRVNGQGRFEIVGLLPGNYLALPLPNNTDEGADPEWLEMMRPTAVPVTVTEGETTRIAVPVPR